MQSSSGELEEALSGVERRRFELGRHCVVEPVQEAEQRDHRDDVNESAALPNLVWRRRGGPSEPSPWRVSYSAARLGVNSSGNPL